MRYLAGLALLLGGCIPPGYEPAPYDPPRAAAEREPLAPPPGWERQTLDEGVTALPAPRPAWESRPVTADAVEVAQQDYVVRSGDTLRGIAERTGAGSEAIARANAIEPPFTIRPGQRLAIPAGRYHLVRAGETGIAIARAYSVEWSRIVADNVLEEPYVLRVGQRIAIPGSTRRPATPAERAAAFRLDIDDILTGGEPALPPRTAPARPATTTARVLPPSAAVATPARFSGGFAWPARGPVVARFGRGASGVRNDGIKIAVPVGTPVLAAADGVVAYVGAGVATLGGVVIVRHGDGWTTIYAHASQLLVQRGQSVKRGQTLALSGDSGATERPAVHFEIRKGRSPVDPLAQLPRL